MCASACLVLMAPSLSAADEKLAYSQAGSFWNYELTDDIKGNKFVFEWTQTETPENQHVLRFNTRGVNNAQIYVYDDRWNELQAGVTKFEPAHIWMPDHLAIGAKSSSQATYSIQRAASWSDPKRMTTESEITADEEVTTKAGSFQAWRVEITTKYAPLPEAPLTAMESKDIIWFSPSVDHWVKSTHEFRRDGRLTEKTSQMLIEYKVK
jgi:hypothetical protein